MLAHIEAMPLSRRDWSQASLFADDRQSYPGLGHTVQAGPLITPRKVSECLFAGLLTSAVRAFVQFQDQTRRLDKEVCLFRTPTVEIDA